MDINTSLPQSPYFVMPRMIPITNSATEEDWNKIGYFTTARESTAEERLGLTGVQVFTPALYTPEIGDKIIASDGKTYVHTPNTTPAHEQTQPEGKGISRHNERLRVARTIRKELEEEKDPARRLELMRLFEKLTSQKNPSKRKKAKARDRGKRSPF